MCELNGLMDENTSYFGILGLHDKSNMAIEKQSQWKMCGLNGLMYENATGVSGLPDKNNMAIEGQETFTTRQCANH